MFKKLILMSLISATVIVTGCQSIPSDTSVNSMESANLAHLRQHTWVLTQLGNMQVTTATTTTNIPSLQFSADGRVSGADGCNRLIGTYHAGYDTLNFSQMAGTKMACADKNYVPAKFNQRLTHVTHYQVFHKTLRLLDSNGNALLQFESSVQPR